MAMVYTTGEFFIFIMHGSMTSVTQRVKIFFANFTVNHNHSLHNRIRKVKSSERRSCSARGQVKQNSPAHRHCANGYSTGAESNGIGPRRLHFPQVIISSRNISSPILSDFLEVELYDHKNRKEKDPTYLQEREEVEAIIYPGKSRNDFPDAESVSAIRATPPAGQDRPFHGLLRGNAPPETGA